MRDLIEDAADGHAAAAGCDVAPELSHLGLGARLAEPRGDARGEVAEELLLREEPELLRKAPVLPDALLEYRSAELPELRRRVDHPGGEIAVDGPEEPLCCLAGRDSVRDDSVKDRLHVKIHDLLPRPAPVGPVAGLPRAAEPGLHPRLCVLQ